MQGVSMDFVKFNEVKVQRYLGLRIVIAVLRRGHAKRRSLGPLVQAGEKNEYSRSANM